MGNGFERSTEIFELKIPSENEQLSGEHINGVLSRAFQFSGDRFQLLDDNQKKNWRIVQSYSNIIIGIPYTFEALRNELDAIKTQQTGKPEQYTAYFIVNKGKNHWVYLDATINPVNNSVSKINYWDSLVSSGNEEELKTSIKNEFTTAGFTVSDTTKIQTIFASTQHDVWSCGDRALEHLINTVAQKHSVALTDNPYNGLSQNSTSQDLRQRTRAAISNVTQNRRSQSATNLQKSGIENNIPKPRAASSEPVTPTSQNSNVPELPLSPILPPLKLPGETVVSLESVSPTTMQNKPELKQRGIGRTILKRFSMRRRPASEPVSPNNEQVDVSRGTQSEQTTPRTGKQEELNVTQLASQQSPEPEPSTLISEELIESRQKKPLAKVWVSPILSESTQSRKKPKFKKIPERIAYARVPSEDEIVSPPKEHVEALPLTEKGYLQGHETWFETNSNGDNKELIDGISAACQTINAWIHGTYLQYGGTFDQCPLLKLFSNELQKLQGDILKGLDENIGKIEEKLKTLGKALDSSDIEAINLIISLCHQLMGYFVAGNIPACNEARFKLLELLNKALKRKVTADAIEIVPLYGALSVIKNHAEDIGRALIVLTNMTSAIDRVCQEYRCSIFELEQYQSKVAEKFLKKMEEIKTTIQKEDGSSKQIKMHVPNVLQTACDNVNSGTPLEQQPTSKTPPAALSSLKRQHSYGKYRHLQDQQLEELVDRITQIEEYIFQGSNQFFSMYEIISTKRALPKEFKQDLLAKLQTIKLQLTRERQAIAEEIAIRQDEVQFWADRNKAQQQLDRLENIKTKLERSGKPEHAIIDCPVINISYAQLPRVLAQIEFQLTRLTENQIISERRTATSYLSTLKSEIQKIIEPNMAVELYFVRHGLSSRLSRDYAQWRTDKGLNPINMRSRDELIDAFLDQDSFEFLKTTIEGKQKEIDDLKKQESHTRPGEMTTLWETPQVRIRQLTEDIRELSALYFTVAQQFDLSDSSADGNRRSFFVNNIYHHGEWMTNWLIQNIENHEQSVVKLIEQIDHSNTIIESKIAEKISELNICIDKKNYRTWVNPFSWGKPLKSTLESRRRELEQFASVLYPDAFTIIKGEEKKALQAELELLKKEIKNESYLKFGRQWWSSRKLPRKSTLEKQCQKLERQIALISFSKKARDFQIVIDSPKAEQFVKQYNDTTSQPENKLYFIAKQLPFPDSFKLLLDEQCPFRQSFIEKYNEKFNGTYDVDAIRKRLNDPELTIQHAELFEQLKEKSKEDLLLMKIDSKRTDIYLTDTNRHVSAYPQLIEQCVANFNPPATFAELEELRQKHVLEGDYSDLMNYVLNGLLNHQVFESPITDNEERNKFLGGTNRGFVLSLIRQLKSRITTEGAGPLFVDEQSKILLTNYGRLQALTLLEQLLDPEQVKPKLTDPNNVALLKALIPSWRLDGKSVPDCFMNDLDSQLDTLLIEVGREKTISNHDMVSKRVASLAFNLNSQTGNNKNAVYVKYGTYLIWDPVMFRVANGSEVNITPEKVEELKKRYIYLQLQNGATGISEDYQQQMSLAIWQYLYGSVGGFLRAYCKGFAITGYEILSPDELATLEKAYLNANGSERKTALLASFDTLCGSKDQNDPIRELRTSLNDRCDNLMGRAHAIEPFVGKSTKYMLAVVYLGSAQQQIAWLSLRLSAIEQQISPPFFLPVDGEFLKVMQNSNFKIKQVFSDWVGLVLNGKNGDQFISNEEFIKFVLRYANDDARKTIIQKAIRYSLEHYLLTNNSPIEIIEVIASANEWIRKEMQTDGIFLNSIHLQFTDYLNEASHIAKYDERNQLLFDKYATLEQEQTYYLRGIRWLLQNRKSVELDYQDRMKSLLEDDRLPKVSREARNDVCQNHLTVDYTVGELAWSETAEVVFQACGANDLLKEIHHNKVNDLLVQHDIKESGRYVRFIKDNKIEKTGGEDVVNSEVDRLINEASKRGYRMRDNAAVENLDFLVEEFGTDEVKQKYHLYRFEELLNRCDSILRPSSMDWKFLLGKGPLSLEQSINNVSIQQLKKYFGKGNLNRFYEMIETFIDKGYGTVKTHPRALDIANRIISFFGEGATALIENRNLQTKYTTWYQKVMQLKNSAVESKTQIQDLVKSRSIDRFIANTKQPRSEAKQVIECQEMTKIPQISEVDAQTKSNRDQQCEQILKKAELIKSNYLEAIKQFKTYVGMLERIEYPNFDLKISQVANQRNAEIIIKTIENIPEPEDVTGIGVRKLSQILKGFLDEYNRLLQQLLSLSIGIGSAQFLGGSVRVTNSIRDIMLSLAEIEFNMMRERIGATEAGFFEKNYQTFNEELQQIDTAIKQFVAKVQQESSSGFLPEHKPGEVRAKRLSPDWDGFCKGLQKAEWIEKKAWQSCATLLQPEHIEKGLRVVGLDKGISIIKIFVFKQFLINVINSLFKDKSLKSIRDQLLEAVEQVDDNTILSWSDREIKSNLNIRELLKELLTESLKTRISKALSEKGGFYTTEDEVVSFFIRERYSAIARQIPGLASSVHESLDEKKSTSDYLEQLIRQGKALFGESFDDGIKSIQYAEQYLIVRKRLIEIVSDSTGAAFLSYVQAIQNEMSQETLTKIRSMFNDFWDGDLRSSIEIRVVEKIDLRLESAINALIEYMKPNHSTSADRNIEYYCNYIQLLNEIDQFKTQGELSTNILSHIQNVLNDPDLMESQCTNIRDKLTVGSDESVDESLKNVCDYIKSLFDKDQRKSKIQSASFYEKIADLLRRAMIEDVADNMLLERKHSLQSSLLQVPVDSLPEAGKQIITDTAKIELMKKLRSQFLEFMRKAQEKNFTAIFGNIDGIKFLASNLDSMSRLDLIGDVDKAISEEKNQDSQIVSALKAFSALLNGTKLGEHVSDENEKLQSIKQTSVAGLLIKIHNFNENNLTSMPLADENKLSAQDIDLYTAAEETIRADINNEMEALFQTRIDACEFGAAFFSNSECGLADKRSMYQSAMSDMQEALKVCRRILEIQSALTSGEGAKVSFSLEDRKSLLFLKRKMQDKSLPEEIRNGYTAIVKGYFNEFKSKLLKFKDQQATDKASDLCYENRYMIEIFPKIFKPINGLPNYSEEIKDSRKFKDACSEKKIETIRKHFRDRSNQLNINDRTTKKESRRTLKTFVVSKKTKEESEILRRVEEGREKSFFSKTIDQYNFLYLTNEEVEAVKLAEIHNLASDQVRKFKEYLTLYMFNEEGAVQEYNGKELLDLVCARNVLERFATEEQIKGIQTYMISHQYTFSVFQDNKCTSEQYRNYILLVKMLSNLLLEHSEWKMSGVDVVLEEISKEKIKEVKTEINKRLDNIRNDIVGGNVDKQLTEVEDLIIANGNSPKQLASLDGLKAAREEVKAHEAESRVTQEAAVAGPTATEAPITPPIVVPQARATTETIKPLLQRLELPLEQSQLSKNWAEDLRQALEDAGKLRAELNLKLRQDVDATFLKLRSSYTDSNGYIYLMTTSDDEKLKQLAAKLITRIEYEYAKNKAILGYLEKQPQQKSPLDSPRPGTPEPVVNNPRSENVEHIV